MRKSHHIFLLKEAWMFCMGIVCEITCVLGVAMSGVSGMVLKSERKKNLT